MSIAIIGGGFAGVATAWHLTHTYNFQVTLFDPAGIGGGPSGMAAGLLHPYAGAHAKLNWRGHEGMAASLKLLQRVPQAAQNTGLLRPAFTKDQETDFALSAEKNSDVQWTSNSLVNKPGIFISNAWTVDCKKYLEGLWKDCPNATLKIEKIDHLDELEKFDVVVIATAFSALEFANIKLTAVKGQLLQVEWPEDLPPLPFPISSQAYIVMQPDKKSCIIGSTFEKGFSSPLPDIKKASAELKPKYTQMIPGLENAKIIDCRAGVRAATPDHRPLIRQINARTWIFTGLGSKGLLYHALIASELAQQLSLSLKHAPRQQN